jgi:hypothetical protein
LELKIGETKQKRNASKCLYAKQSLEQILKDGSRRNGWMSDQGSPAADGRAKSEERPIADHQSVSAQKHLLLHRSLLLLKKIKNSSVKRKK